MEFLQLTRDQHQPPSGAEPLGHVIAVRGSQVTLALRTAASNGGGEERVTVGTFVGIRVGDSLLLAMITNVAVQSRTVSDSEGGAVAADLDMLGEIQNHGRSDARFQRGIVNHPAIGDCAIRAGSPELRLAFTIGASNIIDIGHLHQDHAVSAHIDVDHMLNKHFAVLGTTGVGKSSGVAVLLHEILKARPDVRIFLLDAHNEYGRCFGDRAQVINTQNLKLPFWLFSFEELCDVFFGGRKGLEEEIEYLAEVIPIAKNTYAQNRRPTDSPIIRRTDSRNVAFTIDTPVPFRITDLVMLLNERMGKLENRSSRLAYYKLMTRIETVVNDPRHAFMFENANVGGDTMAEVLSRLFRLPTNGVPMTVMQFAGFPSDVLDAVVSVLCRMAFELGLWSDGVSPLLLVCEEAHRYVSADRSLGFDPTRRSIARIAKEGRKYGVFLGLISQRPSEIDPTILSQCSTLFAMRMTNDNDQDLVRTTVPDTATSLLSFLPSLGTREVFAFGEGVAMPSRLRFKEMAPEMLPRSDATGVDPRVVDPEMQHDFMASVVERWRGVRTPADGPDLSYVLGGADLQSSFPIAPTSPHQSAEPEHFGQLRRPSTMRAEDTLRQTLSDRWRK